MKERVDNPEIRAAIARAPKLSACTAGLLELCNNPAHGLADIVRIVSCDAALTAHILRQANSAAFSRGQAVDSIDRAVALLGGDLVVSMAISDEIGPQFHRELVGYGGARDELWRHDLRTGLAAKLLAGKARPEVDADLAFTAGMLHDLGKAILSDFLAGTVAKVTAAVDAGEFADYPAAERAMLGVDHGEIGYLLARRWGLPEPLLGAIRYHHQPGNAEPAMRPLVYVVHLGDLVAMLGGCGTGADSLRCALDPQYQEYVDLDADGLAAIILAVEEEFTALNRSLFGQGES